jgi:hypothetical protein
VPDPKAFFRNRIGALIFPQLEASPQISGFIALIIHPIRTVWSMDESKRRKERRKEGKKERKKEGGKTERQNEPSPSCLKRQKCTRK